MNQQHFNENMELSNPGQITVIPPNGGEPMVIEQEEIGNAPIDWFIGFDTKLQLEELDIEISKHRSKESDEQARPFCILKTWIQKGYINYMKARTERVLKRIATEGTLTQKMVAIYMRQVQRVSPGPNLNNEYVVESVWLALQDYMPKK